MTLGTLNSQQLRSIVQERWEGDPTAVAFGLHVSSSWSGPTEVDLNFGKAHVRRADNVFHAREILREAENKNDRIILLTKLQASDLGQDVVARLARSRLFVVDHVASLCGLFKAKELDHSICEPSIAQALLECSPKAGFPPVSAGVLDAGTVWRAVCRHVFEMGDREPDQVTLLLWATTASGPQRYIDATEELRASLRDRLNANLGNVADTILRFVDSGAGPDALALAVTCQVIFGGTADQLLDASAARLEQYHQNRPVSKNIGRLLGNLATEALADLDKKADDPKIVQAHLQRADELLGQLRCEAYAYRSSLTRGSYDQRLARFAEQIRATVGNPTEDAILACERLQVEVASHRQGQQRRFADQLSRSEMAVRLIRWLKRAIPSSPTFSEVVTAYIKELSFVDWAREAIVRGDDTPELTAAYQHLDAKVADRQSQFSKAFATGLADWASVGSKNASILGVEDVLKEVVAKVVQANNRVLMIVLDGMSWAVCHELLEDIRQDHWFEATLDKDLAPPSVIATVPSATMYSRTSLMSGELCVGDASTERRKFGEVSALMQCSDRRHPPVVYHKKDITEGSRGGVSQELRDVILSTGQRIIAVVINAIDDRLAGAAQIRDNWTINRITPLGELLRLARDSGRVVILASDHGHVWHRVDAVFEPSSEGSRWRQNDGECDEGEIVITGERVLPEGAEGSVIVPWSERIHYKRPHHGYHGGATPQEMVCPLVLLRDRSIDDAGLFKYESLPPEWWSSAPIATPVEEEMSTSVVVPTGPRTLFDDLPDEKAPVQKPVAATTTHDWIERLFVSQAYKDQKAMIRRHVPDDDTVRSILEALSGNGGIMTPAAFARVANISAARLDGLMAQIGRILNVDGYEILSLDRNKNRIELNVIKLKRQFDLE